MTRMSRTERSALCDTALQVGEDQPTLCEGWSVKDLVVHLLVRERSIAAAGLALPPLRGLLERESRRYGAQDFSLLVERLRQGPPPWSPYVVPKLDAVANSLEFYVHHEDVRRAQPGWEPRELSADEQKLLWSMVRTAGKALVRKAPAGVAIENSTTGSRTVLKEAPTQVVVRGLPSELVLFLFGRKEHAQVELLGTDDDVSALGGASLGF